MVPVKEIGSFYFYYYFYQKCFREIKDKYEKIQKTEYVKKGGKRGKNEIGSF